MTLHRAAIAAVLAVAAVAGSSVVTAAPATAAPVPVVSSPAPVLSAPVAQPTLRWGSRGPAVADVQSRVGVTTDGIFGPVTDGAVRRFQGSRGLVVDGIVGPRTWAVLTGAAVREDRPSREGARPALGGADAVVAFARAQVGDAYVWGGNGPDAWDCSGFVQAAYRQAGVSLPRTSGAQAAAGRRVSAGEARPGDLVTYPGHIGIYVGGGRMIDASKPGRPVGERAVWGSPSYVRVLS